MGANDTLTIFAVRSFFVLSVLTGGVIGLGLTNAVFVDEMMDNNEPLERNRRPHRRDCKTARRTQPISPIMRERGLFANERNLRTP